VNDRRLHFGLGTNTHANLEIHWTNGLVERFTGIAANQLITITEGRGMAATPLPGMKTKANSERQNQR
jgi:enediyne biosynthesis protein E4